MKNLFKNIVLTGAMMAASASASAGLIVNGSFENNDIRNNSWSWFSSDQVDGWNGSNIEIWDSLQNFASFDGDQHAELNAHGPNQGAWSVYQSFMTVANQSYDVSFAYASRRSGGEAFLFEILDDTNNVLFSQLIDDHLQKSWQVFETQFDAVSFQSTLRFTSQNSGTYGNFLDAVDVSAAEIPEPMTLIMLGAGLFALGLRVNRKPKAKAN